MVLVGMATALALGAATAVVASGAGNGTAITIGDNPGDEITVYGSGGADTITYGGFTGGVTIEANRTISSLRHDCEVSEPQVTVAFCSREEPSAYSKLESRLGKGTDRLEFYESFDAPGFEIIGRGGDGADSLSGAEKKDRFNGGRGGDQLFGLEGNDNLNGGRGTDLCDGGPGNNQISNCEPPTRVR